MRFWDSSAVVPLVCAETQSARCRSWLERDQTMIVWLFAATEVISALVRRHRDGSLKRVAFTDAKRRLATLERTWHEVIEVDAVRARARRLLEVHPLRASDALHLAGALVAFEERPSNVEFVTFDTRLAEAAEKEGFQVLA